MSKVLTQDADYLARVARKRAQQLSAIPLEWRLHDVPSVETNPNALAFIRDSGLLSSQELEITEILDVRVLLGKIARRELSALNVTRAYAKRAAFAHQLTNCCTEIFFEQAFEEATRLDEILAATGKVVGPLHGLPVSIKDCLAVKGQDTTIGNQFLSRFPVPYLLKALGWVGLAGQPASEDAYAVSMLRRLGAILFVKTNVPQSLMVGSLPARLH